MELNKESPEKFNSPDEFNQAESEQVEHVGSGQVEQPERHEFEEEGTGAGADGGYQQQTEVERPVQNDNPSTEHTTLHNREVDFQPSTHGRSTGRMVGHEPGIDNAV